MTGIELVLMDADFKRLRIIRDFTSLMWTERYYGDGSFEVGIPSKYLDSAIVAAYVFRKDKTDTGLITRIIKNSDGVVLRGEFLSSLLKTRVVDSVFSFNGALEDAARALVNNYCISAAGARKIEKLALGASVSLGKSANWQISGKSVYDALRELLTEQEASFTLRYDIYEKMMYFDILQGLDRTSSQNVNSWCVFSKDYYNILSETYELSGDYRNFAYVVSGAQDGVAPAVAVVDLVKDGEKRRELYVEAKDIWKGSGVTDASLQPLLYERGVSKLAEYNDGETAECMLDMSRMGNMPFSLGDKCTYVNSEMGITAEGRITELEEVSEGGELSTSISLGREQLDLVRKIKRDIGK